MQQKQFLDFLDMIDGGGAGQMGDRFEGGGLYSILANLVANPYGSEDEERRAARQEAFGIMDMASQPSMSGSSATPPAPPARSPQADAMAAQIAAEAQMGLDPFGGAGPNVTGAAAERGMGLGPFGNAGDPAVYSGRGYSGMPYPEGADTQEIRDLIDYLRSQGVTNY